MSTIDIKVPNIGDFKDVEIIEVLVQNGQEIRKGDSIITCLLYTSDAADE